MDRPFTRTIRLHRPTQPTTSQGSITDHQLQLEIRWQVRHMGKIEISTSIASGTMYHLHICTTVPL